MILAVNTMSLQTNQNFNLRTYQQIAGIDPGLWDGAAPGQPFGSHRWHSFAETVMADCRPFYILVFDGERLAGRAAFYLVPSEPLPLEPIFLRGFAQKFFRRWPLMIGRVPFAGLSGIVLPEGVARAQVLGQVAAAARRQAREWRASFVFFDFVEKELAGAAGWPPGFRPMEINEPGTQMALAWPNFESYLASLGKDERYHYRRIQRKARELGIVVERHSRAERMEEALALIREVERRHAAAPSPWTRALLENLHLADAAWLTARVGRRLVGCGLSLWDNGAQVNTALGLAEDVPYVYFALMYESLRLAFENNIRLVRLGSGAYDVKRRLGFQVENNNYVVAASPNFLLQQLITRMT
jgi:predicted N-acyltransferase